MVRQRALKKIHVKQYTKFHLLNHWNKCHNVLKKLLHISLDNFTLLNVLFTRVTNMFNQFRYVFSSKTRVGDRTHCQELLSTLKYKTSSINYAQ